MKTYKIYVPQRYQYGVNDLGIRTEDSAISKTITATYDVPVPLAQISRQLGEIVPGWTLSLGSGHWQGIDDIYDEPVYIFEIVTALGIEFQDKLVLLLNQWKEDFNQEAMFYQVYESEGILL